MTNPTPEDLIRWRDAGVLFEFSDSGKAWYGSQPHNGTDEDGWFIGPHDAGWRYIRPYRAPGHIQPHDGSPERPEWVGGKNKIMTYRYDQWIEHHDMSWKHVRFFIVLPETNTANNGGN